MDNSSCSEYWPETETETETETHFQHLQEVAASTFLLPFIPNTCDWSQHIEEDKSVSASRSHSEAEKRRRDRINAQFSTLRKIIPSSEKMDKAALLTSVVEHVKDLKGRAKEISKAVNTPTDIDEVIIEHLENHENSSNSIIVKVCLCCDDRPELFSEINRALKNLKLTIVEANIISLGGRIKCIFVLKSINGVCLNYLKQSLRVVLSRITISPATSNYRIKSKRQRFFLPANFS